MQMMMSMSMIFLFFLLSVSVGNAQDTDSTSGIDVPSTLQALSTQCPGEVVRLTPCLNRNTDLANCTECVSNFIVESEEVLNNAAVNAPEDNDSAETRQSTNSTTGEEEDDVCLAVESVLCNGIETCGTSCGLVNSQSIFTFGSDCQTLFVNLVTCVLSSQNVAPQCNLADAACLEELQVASAPSLHSQHAKAAVLLTTVGGLTLFLLMMGM
ncbi:hypothetical protein IV203_006379 [Nitzschia inconspicua]|uniref:Uncharacterized protein n=1 Tax=Nitzschia inconspicua TaxID=303405 RepID=A0A9K3KBA7_9STRA|nr:hypothetical protein IV203_006595 [Nitzschia inconspicua]KAG7339976.1 hypothetical protein IV203_006379 [Nitzschia inconspicua]